MTVASMHFVTAFGCSFVLSALVFQVSKSPRIIVGAKINNLNKTAK